MEEKREVSEHCGVPKRLLKTGLPNVKPNFCKRPHKLLSISPRALYIQSYSQRPYQTGGLVCFGFIFTLGLCHIILMEDSSIICRPRSHFCKGTKLYRYLCVYVFMSLEKACKPHYSVITQEREVEMGKGKSFHFLHSCALFQVVNSM